MAPYAVNTLKLIFDNGILDFLIAPPKNLDNLEKLIRLIASLGIEKTLSAVYLSCLNQIPKEPAGWQIFSD